MNYNAPTIRLATPQDIPSVATLFQAYREFYECPITHQAAVCFLQDRLRLHQSVLFYATVRDIPAGFIQCYPSFCSLLAAPIYVLYDLYVANELRIMGVGRELMQFAEQHARESGVRQLQLTTSHGNMPAQTLYESMGWEKDSVFQIYTKTLEPTPS